jgi:CheY-like chemotaxis protein
MLGLPQSLVVKRILVVDDEPIICNLLQGILSGAGLVVDVATSGPEALRLFRENRYDLLTLDVMMPGMDGTELHCALSRVYGFGRPVPESLPQRLPPVLVITGHPQQAVLKDIIVGERVVGFLQKPVGAEQLLAIVTDLLEWESSRAARRARALERLGSHIASQN